MKIVVSWLIPLRPRQHPPKSLFQNSVWKNWDCSASAERKQKWKMHCLSTTSTSLVRLAILSFSSSSTSSSSELGSELKLSEDWDWSAGAWTETVIAGASGKLDSCFFCFWEPFRAPKFVREQAKVLLQPPKEVEDSFSLYPFFCCYLFQTGPENSYWLSGCSNNN